MGGGNDADEQPRPAPGWRKAEAQPVWKRLAWMIAIWAASVAALGVVAFIIRAWLSP